MRAPFRPLGLVRAPNRCRRRRLRYVSLAKVRRALRWPQLASSPAYRSLARLALALALALGFNAPSKRTFFETTAAAHSTGASVHNVHTTATHIVGEQVSKQTNELVRAIVALVLRQADHSASQLVTMAARLWAGPLCVTDWAVVVVVAVARC